MLQYVLIVKVILVILIQKKNKQKKKNKKKKTKQKKKTKKNKRQKTTCTLVWVKNIKAMLQNASLSIFSLGKGREYIRLKPYEKL